MVGVEALQVAQAVPGGIPELQVVLAQLLENLLGAADVGVVIRSPRPQPDDVRAVLLDQLIGVHAVAQRLVHGPSLAVHGPAVGQDLAEGCTLLQSAHSREQAGLEPAPVLVRPLQIHIRRPLSGVVMVQGGKVGGAGVKPAVQGVRLLLKVLSAAVGAGKAFRNQLHSLLLEPNVGAGFPEEPGDVGDGLLGADGLTAVLAIKHRDGHAPPPLPGDAPVGPLPEAEAVPSGSQKRL